MKTEAEACECWCPYSSVEGSNRVYVDLGGLAAATRCIASACMAWRVIDGTIEAVNFEKLGEKPEGDGWVCTIPEADRENFVVKSQWQRKIEARGYCGLAGRP